MSSGIDVSVSNSSSSESSISASHPLLLAALTAVTLVSSTNDLMRTLSVFVGDFDAPFAGSVWLSDDARSDTNAWSILVKIGKTAGVKGNAGRYELMYPAIDSRYATCKLAVGYVKQHFFRLRERRAKFGG